MKKLLSLILVSCMLLTLTACKGAGESESTQAPAETAAPEASQAPALEMTSYTYTFQGLMGEETAQIDLYTDGTCQFFLPNHPMIKDVYAGTYTRDGAAVSIVGLTNVDASSAYAQPGLWDWIVSGNANVTVDEDAKTFAPNEAVSEDAPAPVGPAAGDNGMPGIKNLSYGSLSDNQVLDIYTPEGAEKAPVIVLIHGGGFMFGDQGMNIIVPVIRKALEHGYAVAAIDYRKSSEAVFPGALCDVKAAVRWIRAHAMDYGFNPEHVALWGESAGAYLASMAALTPDAAALNGDMTEYDKIPNGVAAFVSFYAPIEFYTLYDEAGKPDGAAASFESKFLGQDIMADKEKTYSTYWETYKDQIPSALKAWIQAGDADEKVPYTQSENFAARLIGYLGEENVKYSLIPGAGHEDGAFYTDENLDAVFAWLDGFMK